MGAEPGAGSPPHCRHQAGGPGGRGPGYSPTKASVPAAHAHARGSLLLAGAGLSQALSWCRLMSPQDENPSPSFQAQDWGGVLQPGWAWRPPEASLAVGEFRFGFLSAHLSSGAQDREGSQGPGPSLPPSWYASSEHQPCCFKHKAGTTASRKTGLPSGCPHSSVRLCRRQQDRGTGQLRAGDDTDDGCVASGKLHSLSEPLRSPS